MNLAQVFRTLWRNVNSNADLRYRLRWDSGLRGTFPELMTQELQVLIGHLNVGMAIGACSTALSAFFGFRFRPFSQQVAILLCQTLTVAFQKTIHF